MNTLRSSKPNADNVEYGEDIKEQDDPMNNDARIIVREQDQAQIRRKVNTMLSPLLSPMLISKIGLTFSFICSLTDI